jgi:DNA replicative helicase MCM subunit Mcm2 (Cdc46/Mcm family)
MGLSQHVPNALRRRFRVNFQPDIKCEKRSIRSIRAADIGHLVTFMVCLILELYPEDCILLADTQGICTRVGDVKPLVEVACLTCECCGFEIYQVSSRFCQERRVPAKLERVQEVYGETFNPVLKCPSGLCNGINRTSGENFCPRYHFWVSQLPVQVSCFWRREHQNLLNIRHVLPYSRTFNISNTIVKYQLVLFA